MVQPFLETLNQDQLAYFKKIMRWCSKSERAAVAAETERCANTNPSDVQCPKCAVGPDVPCEDERNKFWIPPHIERWRVAIRWQATVRHAAATHQAAAIPQTAPQNPTETATQRERICEGG